MEGRNRNGCYCATGGARNGHGRGVCRYNPRCSTPVARTCEKRRDCGIRNPNQATTSIHGNPSASQCYRIQSGCFWKKNLFAEPKSNCIPLKSLSNTTFPLC